MGKRIAHSDPMDPEYQRWERKYRRFPGVVEYARLIRTGKAKGSWADIIVAELAEHAATCLPELIETFHNDPSDSVRLYVMMALDIAQFPESVPFLAEVLNDGNPMFTPYAERALRGINTSEARTVLWKATHDDRGTTSFRP